MANPTNENRVSDGTYRPWMKPFVGVWRGLLPLPQRIMISRLRQELSRPQLRLPSLRDLRSYLTLDDVTVGEQFWRRHDGAERRRFAEHYWNDASAPFRGELVDELASLPPFHSILEVGCNSGPNLRRIQQRFPELALWGFDISRESVDWAREHLAQAGARELNLWAADFQAGLARPFDRSVDVVMACLSLTCANPSSLPALLADALRIARVALVLFEPTPGPGQPAGVLKSIPTWTHDYVAVLARLGVSTNAISERVLSHDGHRTSMITVRMK